MSARGPVSGLPLTAALSVVTAAACHHPQAGPPPGPAPVTYTCTDKSSVTVTYMKDTDSARIVHGASTWTLPHVPSASGAHYQSSAASWWDKGKDGTLEVGGQSLSCSSTSQ